MSKKQPAVRPVQETWLDELVSDGFSNPGPCKQTVSTQLFALGDKVRVTVTLIERSGPRRAGKGER